MKITGTTQITGVFGYPVEHSLSPVFQNAAFEFLKLDYVYVPIKVLPEHIGKAVEGLRALNLKGVNLTIPHKKTVLGYLDEVDGEAQTLGVVNTIVNKNDRLKGYSTDGSGFVRSLKEHKSKFVPAGKTVFVIGAGGAAYAITGALVRERVSKIYISNRTEEKAVLLKKQLSEKLGFGSIYIVPFGEINNERYWSETELIVNTTSVGMKEGDPMLINEKNLKRVRFVYDIVYNRKTEMVKTAEENGIPCIDGLSMLIYQGAVSFELWTGEKAPVDVMKQSVLDT
jgi:shikimate dehydrogenase